MNVRHVMLALLCTPGLFAQLSQGSFEKNLAALNCDTAFIVKSPAIRHPIHWSPDGKELGVKVDGRWVRIALDALVLKRYKWRDNQDIAGPIGLPELKPLDDRTRAGWFSAEEEHSKKIRCNNGVRIEFTYAEDAALALRVSWPDGMARDLWRTKLEDCGGLVLSPDHRWVAYIGSVSGVIVLKVPQQ